MKRLIVLVLLALTWVAPAMAELKLPRKTFRVAELEKAQEAAREKNRALLFLYGTTCTS